MDLQMVALGNRNAKDMKGRGVRDYIGKQQKQMQENTIRYQNIPTVQPVYSSSSSSRSNYAELWEECEDMEAVLNDADIDHDDLSYPMDYHELEDLRDEYQSLLEENDIDY